MAAVLPFRWIQCRKVVHDSRVSDLQRDARPDRLRLACRNIRRLHGAERGHRLFVHWLLDQEERGVLLSSTRHIRSRSIVNTVVTREKDTSQTAQPVLRRNR